MKNGPLEDVFPIENGDLFQPAMLVVFLDCALFWKWSLSSTNRVLVGWIFQNRPETIVARCKAIATAMLSKIWRTSCFCDFGCSPQIVPLQKGSSWISYLRDQVGGLPMSFRGPFSVIPSKNPSNSLSFNPQTNPPFFSQKKQVSVDSKQDDKHLRICTTHSV